VFETFWQYYPRKIEKIAAYKNWNAQLKAKHTAEQMIVAAKNYAEYCKNEDTETRYIKHPSTFLGHTKPFLEYVKGVPASNKPDKSQQSINSIQSWLVDYGGGDDDAQGDGNHNSDDKF
jgi:hypothetical protein